MLIASQPHQSFGQRRSQTNSKSVSRSEMGPFKTAIKSVEKNQWHQSFGKPLRKSRSGLSGPPEQGHISRKTVLFAVLICAESCLLLNVLLQAGQICYLVSTLKKVRASKFWASKGLRASHQKGGQMDREEDPRTMKIIKTLDDFG